MKRCVIWFFLLSVLLVSFVACSPKVVEYQLEVKVEGRGEVTPQKGKFKKDQIITFELKPDAGWLFSHWGGESVSDVLRSGDSWKLLMNGNKKLTAIFKEIDDNVQRKLVVAVEGEGSVTPNLGLYKNGEKVIFTLKPAAGWEFSHWEGKNRNDVHLVADKWQLIMDGDKNLTAVFGKKEIEGFLLDVTIKGQGSVAINPDKEYYDPNTLVELKATPDEGWLFKGWFGDVEDTEEAIEIMMDDDKKVIAEFTPIIYHLDLNIVGNGYVEQKTIYGGANISYVHGTIVELTAIPAEGWLFGEWRGALESTESKITIEMDDNKKLTVIFLEKSYSIDIEVVGEGRVEEKLLSSFGTKDYNGGEIVQLTAVPAEGWQFKEWQGDVEGTGEVVEIKVDGDKKVIAVFNEIEVITFKLTVTVNGEGEVTRAPEADEYPEGTVVTLNAIPKTGWEFTEWQGAASDNTATITVVMDEDKELIAVFEELITWKLNIAIEGEGTVTKDPDAEEYRNGTVVTLTATPQDGWEFIGWQGDFEGTKTVIEIEMDKDLALKATFKKIINYKLEVDIEGKGSVTKDPDAEEYREGTVVTLTAVPQRGWEFIGWKGDFSSSEPVVKIEMDDDKKVLAVFKEIIFYRMKLDIEGQGTVKRDPDAVEYREGTIVTLTAVPKDGWRFQEWKGVVASTKAVIEITMDSDKEITAVFRRARNYTIAINTKGRGSVDRNPNAIEYVEDTIVKLIAKPEVGWRFVEWAGDASGTEKEIDITVTKNMKISATFEKIPHYRLLVYTVGSGTFRVTPDQIDYEEGTKVVLYALPSYGWNPDSYWEIDGVRFSSSAIELVMDKEITATAYFNSMGFDEEIDQ